MNTEPEVVTGWDGVAKAAQWLAEGREVDKRPPMQNPACPVGWTAFHTGSDSTASDVLTPYWEYRLNPEPRKPREWVLERCPAGGRTVNVWGGPWFEVGETIRVREVLEDGA